LATNITCLYSRQQFADSSRNDSLPFRIGGNILKGPLYFPSFTINPPQGGNVTVPLTLLQLVTPKNKKQNLAGTMYQGEVRAELNLGVENIFLFIEKKRECGGRLTCNTTA